jgi:peptide/nickel transport system substrate-binding protein
MSKKQVQHFAAVLIVLSLLLGACGQATPAPPATSAPATQAPDSTQAPAATQPPAATQSGGSEPATASSCPHSTVANPLGVPAGAWPQQWELEEFESLANCKFVFSGRTTFDERLYTTNLVPNPLPPIEQRLPDEPLVVQPYDEIGSYGGRVRFASIGPESGNSEFLSARHVNLVRMADDLVTVVPNVAKHYEWNSDYTELTIVLRTGHKWSDGEPFTADDVLFWYNDIILNKDLTPAVPTHWVFGGEPMRMTKVDDVTVKINFAAPAPGFLTLAATTYIQMYAPKHFLEDKHLAYNADANAVAAAAGYSDWIAHFYSWHNDWQDAVHHLSDVGYMPPKLESHVLVVETPEFQLFVANPFYFKVDTAGQQLPYIDEQHQSYAPDRELIELKIINGEIDVKAQSLVIGSLPLYQQNVERGNFSIQMPPGAGSGRIYTFNCTHKDPVLREIFSNPRFNEAMSLALNRAEINQTLNFGLSEPVQGIPVHWTASFAKPEWYAHLIEFDPARANQILDEIGLTRGSDGFRLRPDGRPLVVQILFPLQAGDTALHELAKEYWDAVGVRIELREVSTEAYRTIASGNDHDVAVFDSGTTTEAPLYANPFRLYPPFGDAALEPLCGGPWAEWRDTNGASGLEPPDDVKRLWDLTDQWKSQPPGTAEYTRLGQEIVEIHRKYMWLIGTVTPTPAVTVVSRSLGNVTPWTINAFEYYRTYPFRTDQWFFKS